MAEEQQSLTGRKELAPVPEPGLSEAQLVEFIPHRANRPEKTEVGRAFKMVSEFEPAGDQPQAITELIDGIEDSERDQVLLGVTGSGKTFTMAQVIQRTQRPALILAPNKTLAAQLYGEFKGFFPDNAVEYFVSYYDYYQPEAYVPRTDTYIEKESNINEQIDRMRHSATRALLERDDVIIVASVSCIYGIGQKIDKQIKHDKLHSQWSQCGRWQVNYRLTRNREKRGNDMTLSVGAGIGPLPAAGSAAAVPNPGRVLVAQELLPERAPVGIFSGFEIFTDTRAVGPVIKDLAMPIEYQ